MPVAPNTAVLVDYENVRREALERGWQRLVPNLRAWVEHFVGRFTPPMLVRFYHGWYTHQLDPTDDLKALNIELYDPAVRSRVWEASKRVSVPNAISFEAATTLWRHTTALPTSRRHTTADCSAGDCPRHGYPVQKMVDAMLVRDAIELSRVTGSVVLVSGDDDVLPAFAHACQYLVPSLSLPTPGQRCIQAVQPGAIDTDIFPYSTAAWYARPVGIRR